MKKECVIFSLSVFACTVSGMELQSLVSSGEQSKTFGFLSRTIDAKVSQMNTRNVFDCRAYPTCLEQEIDDCQKNYKVRLGEIGEQNIQWPAEQRDYRLIIAHLANQNITTLSRVEDDTVVSIFQRMPEYIDPLWLTKINVSHNKLQDLPLMSITEICRNLVKLNVSHNAIEHVSFFKRVDADHISQSYVSNNGALKVLDLSYNQLSSFDLGALFDYYPIESVDVSHNPLQDIKALDLNYSDRAFSLRGYTSIDVRNTQLSQEERHILCKKYVRGAQEPFWKEKILTKVMAATCVIPIAPFAAAGSITGNIPLVLLVTFGSGFVGASGTEYGLSRWWYRSELQAIEQEAKVHILFDDTDKELDA